VWHSHSDSVSATNGICKQGIDWKHAAWPAARAECVGVSDWDNRVGVSFTFFAGVRVLLLRDLFRLTSKLLNWTTFILLSIVCMGWRFFCLNRKGLNWSQPKKWTLCRIEVGASQMLMWFPGFCEYELRCVLGLINTLVVLWIAVSPNEAHLFCWSISWEGACEEIGFHFLSFHQWFKRIQTARLWHVFCSACMTVRLLCPREGKTRMILRSCGFINSCNWFVLFKFSVLFCFVLFYFILFVCLRSSL
jgi:hypothetical protein